LPIQDIRDSEIEKKNSLYTWITKDLSPFNIYALKKKKPQWNQYFLKSLKVQTIAKPTWLCINTKNIQQKNPKTNKTLNPSPTKHTRFQNFFHKKISSKKFLKLTKHLTPPKQNIQDFRFFSQKNIQQKNPKTIKRFNPSQTKHIRFHLFVTKNNLAKES